MHTNCSKTSRPNSQKRKVGEGGERSVGGKVTAWKQGLEIRFSKDVVSELSLRKWVYSGALKIEVGGQDSDGSISIWVPLGANTELN